MAAHLAFYFELHFDDAGLYFSNDGLSVLQRKANFLHSSKGGMSFDFGDHLLVECAVLDACLDPEDDSMLVLLVIWPSQSVRYIAALPQL